MLFLSVRGFLDYAGPTVHSRFVWAAVLPSSYSELSRHPDLRAFRSSITPPTDASGLRFKRYLAMTPARLEVRMDSLLLSCRALASPTTCRFIPALSESPVNRNESGLPNTNWRPPSGLASREVFGSAGGYLHCCSRSC